MWRYVFFVVFMTGSIGMAETKAESIPLPEEGPFVPQVVHNREYMMEKKVLLEAGYRQLTGDKFLKGHGIDLAATYYFREEWAVTGGFSYFVYSPTADYENIKQQGLIPDSSNPQYLLRSGILWEPVYGKLAFGNHIQRFKIGLTAGLHFSDEKHFDSAYSENPSIFWGPWLGLQMRTFFSQRISLAIFTDYMRHDQSWKAGSFDKDIWQFGTAVGFRF